MPQRGYLWQRAWNPAVSESALQADQHMGGQVILGGELLWKNREPQWVAASIDWQTVARLRRPVGIGVRVAPFAGPFDAKAVPILAIIKEARNLVASAQAHKVPLSELQLDFDCAQKKLAGYRVWIQGLREAIPGVRLVITALPSWLQEPEFGNLIAECDGYVLQVHSVPTASQKWLCDPNLARQWVQQAAKLERPFSVALPTYRCLAGYDEKGQLLGVIMDSVVPAWPAGTRIVEFKSEPAELAKLVVEWKTSRPKEMRELIWYRLPVATDTYNWRWPTLLAVMEGRRPQPRLEIRQSGDNPIDLELENTGEADALVSAPVEVSWSGTRLIASDALPGWRLQVENQKAVFLPVASSPLPPGARRPIGWLRYEQATQVQIPPQAQ